MFPFLILHRVNHRHKLAHRRLEHRFQFLLVTIQCLGLKAETDRLFALSLHHPRRHSHRRAMPRDELGDHGSRTDGGVFADGGLVDDWWLQELSLDSFVLRLNLRLKTKLIPSKRPEHPPSHAVGQQELDDQPPDIVNRKLRPRNHTILQQANVLVVHSSWWPSFVFLVRRWPL